MHIQVKLRIPNFCKDKNGKVVIFQKPNFLIIAWFVCKMLALTVDAKDTSSGFASLATLFLFAWAYLEITSGDSYFRRLLGLLVALAIVRGFFVA